MFETSNDLRGFVADPQIARAPSSRDILHYGAERSLLLSLFEHVGWGSHAALPCCVRVSAACSPNPR